MALEGLPSVEEMARYMVETHPQSGLPAGELLDGGEGVVRSLEEKGEGDGELAEYFRRVNACLTVERALEIDLPESPEEPSDR